MIKVLIVDDSKVQREFLAHLLSSDPDIRVVGLATSGTEAIELANDSVYGLNASVWSHDKNKALEVTKQITTGGISINNVLVTSANFALPFGGAKQSGIGRYHGPYGLHAFSNIKAVLVEKDKKDNEINWYPFRSDKYERFLTVFKALFSEKTSEKIKGLPSMIRLLRSRE